MLAVVLFDFFLRRIAIEGHAGGVRGAVVAGGGAAGDMGDQALELSRNAAGRPDRMRQI